MPKLFEEITGRIPIECIDERWLTFLPIDWDSRRLYLIIKRAMDIIIAGIGLLVLSPFFLFLALAIMLDLVRSTTMALGIPTIPRGLRTCSWSRTDVMPSVPACCCRETT